jgi:uncharacterized DUF497 family protein
MVKSNLYYNFSPEKNQQLINEHGVSFEMIISILESGEIIETIEHPNKEKYKHQAIYIIQINNYVYMVPFVRKGREIFLKTIFPSRKLTKKYLN